MWNAPFFWHKSHPLAYAFLPFSALYYLGGRLKDALINPWQPPIPVICIGNVVAGGAGKTPVAIALAQRLKTMGIETHIVSRGYGGALVGPLRVDPENHSAAEVGDEPLLIARHVACWMAKDRKRGILKAADAGARVVIMDDGLQNSSVRKTLSIVVIDGGYGVGNGYVIPAGPLRESIRSARKKIQAVIIVGMDRYKIADAFPNLPLFRGRLVPNQKASVDNKRYVAFAGIGRPEKFFTTLREYGAELDATFSFADHHVYSDKELFEMEQMAKKRGISLITTEKDAVRLPQVWREKIETLPVIFACEEQDALDTILTGSVQLPTTEKT
ncbi:MAG: tetraacyldisaccharide 4'-kinase [Rickettsiales bacterium]